MGTGHAGKGMGNEGSSGPQNVGKLDPAVPDEGTLSQQRQGNNQLQGNNQEDTRNQRGSVAGEHDRTEGVVESFERTDPRRR